MMRPTTAEVGRAGEAFARRHLVGAGYQLIAQNWRVRGGEIDIVATDADALVFVEVRARARRGPVIAEATVDERKLSRILLAADAFVQAHPQYQEHVWRIDLIAISIERDGTVAWFRHYQNLTLD
jgi:putative endonuclease